MVNGQRDEWGKGTTVSKKEKKGGIRLMNAFYHKEPANVRILTETEESILSPDKASFFHIRNKNTLLFRLWFFFYLRYMFGVSEIPSSLEEQLCRSVINHR